MSTIAFLRNLEIKTEEILKNQEVIEAKFNTSFVDTHPELTDYEDELPPATIAAAIGAAIAAHEGI